MSTAVTGWAKASSVIHTAPRKFQYIASAGKLEAIEFTEGKRYGTWIYKNGNREESFSWTLGKVLNNPSMFKEIPPSTSPVACVKIPGLHPQEPNALRYLNLEQLDKLEARIVQAREAIRKQEAEVKAKAQATAFKPGDVVAMQGVPSTQKYVVVERNDHNISQLAHRSRHRVLADPSLVLLLRLSGGSYEAGKLTQGFARDLTKISNT